MCWKNTPLKFIALLSSTLFASSCAQEPRIHTEQILALDTIVTVSIADTHSDNSHNTVRKLESLFSSLDTQLSPWNEHSELKQLNDAIESGNSFTASDLLVDLINTSKEHSSEMLGLFTPLIEPLVTAWGFNVNPRNANKPPPGPLQLKHWLSHRVDIEQLIVNENTITTDPHATLDLGGIAKGYALKKAATLFRENNIKTALINAGGDLVAIGQPTTRPWHVGIRHPRDEGILAIVTLSDGESIVTSGDYERAFIYDGKRYHHLLNPHTGMPSSAIVSTTVIANDPVYADALSTALSVSAESEWRPLLEKFSHQPITLVFASGKVLYTAAMEPRFVDTLPDNAERFTP